MTSTDRSRALLGGTGSDEDPRVAARAALLRAAAQSDVGLSLVRGSLGSATAMAFTLGLLVSGARTRTKLVRRLVAWIIAGSRVGTSHQD